jgi:phage gpG-like protein
VTTADLAADFGRAARELRTPPRPLLKLWAVAASADFKRNIAEGHDPDGTPFRPLLFTRASGGSKPLRDRGLLLASLGGGAGYVEQIGADSVTVGTSLMSAATHQFGATITPKKGKYLAIPKTAQSARVGPRQFPGKLIAIFGPRGGVLVERSGKQTTVQYALVKRVMVPARPFIGVGARLAKVLMDITERYLAKAVLGK